MSQQLCLPREELGSAQLLRAPSPSCSFLGWSQSRPTLCQPRLACAAKDSRPQDTELLIWQGFRLLKVSVQQPGCLSSAQASFGVHQLNNKASILDKLVFLFSRYLRGTWFYKKDPTGNSLAVQWLGLRRFPARPGFNPWLGS